MKRPSFQFYPADWRNNANFRYAYPVAETSAIGFRSLKEAATSCYANAMQLFSCLDVPSMGGSGGEAAKPRRCFPGLRTRLIPPTSFRSEWRFVDRTGRHTMAHATSLSAPAQITDELHIDIFPRAYANFRGSAAQLIAEGLIPDGFKWPTGSDNTHYEIGLFSFWMSRCRQKGTTGPAKTWRCGDYWCVRRTLTSMDKNCFHEARVFEKQQELAEVIRHATPAWKRESRLAFAANLDVPYRAFRNLLIPEVKRGRGRPSKAVTSAESDAQTINTDKSGVSNA